MASIKPHAKGWRVFLCVNGVRQSKTFAGKREAAAWAAAMETQLRDVSRLPPGERYTLKEALTKYQAEVSPTKRGARREDVAITAMLKAGLLPLALPMAEVTTAKMALWRDARLQQVSAGSVLREISLLSAIFETARREWQWIAVNPLSDMRKPRAPDHRDVVLTWSQIKAMLRAMGHRRGPCKRASQAAARAFILALRTGMRAGEICKLTWPEVFDDYCVLPVTKTKPRSVPLPPKARAVIASMAGWDDERVFGLTASTLDALFRRYRDRAGLSGFTFHDSRHTAATWLARRLDVLTLCKVFGWSNPKMAMVYYNPTASDIAKRLG